jgi:hypothetical protein
VAWFVRLGPAQRQAACPVVFPRQVAFPQAACRCAAQARQPAGLPSAALSWLRRQPVERRAWAWSAVPVSELRPAAPLSGRQGADRRARPSAWQAAAPLVAWSASERAQQSAACVREAQRQVAA